MKNIIRQMFMKKEKNLIIKMNFQSKPFDLKVINQHSFYQNVKIEFQNIIYIRIY